jgi:alpha-beta hydrolase superfamily lysophospholipase
MIGGAMSAPPRSDDELSALATLAGRELARAVGGVAATHEAIARRAFGANGPAAAPAKAAHDAIAAIAYGSVALGAAGFGRAGGALLRRSGRDPLSSRPRGAAGLAALSGLIGDELAHERSPLAAEMAVRVGGRPVPAGDAAAVRAAFPAAGPRLAVFLHGLMESEFAWGTGPDTYGEALAELGYTAVHVRYNTGRHISANGADLSRLLGDLQASWPAPVTEIALIGHSMGGLVARSAAHQAVAADAGWVTHVRHTVSLGTPHHGAPLPRAVHVADAALRLVPETRALSGLLRRRSAGIRDLRHGSLVDEDWRDRDPDALRAAATAEVPLHPGASHAFVSATVTREGGHPLGRLVGDTLVLAPSAEGRERDQRLAFDAGLRLGGTHHLALLRHPAVRERLCAWLAATPD